MIDLITRLRNEIIIRRAIKRSSHADCGCGEWKQESEKRMTTKPGKNGL